jgi:hypothetical protein
MRWKVREVMSNLDHIGWKRVFIMFSLNREIQQIFKEADREMVNQTKTQGNFTWSPPKIEKQDEYEFCLDIIDNPDLAYITEPEEKSYGSSNAKLRPEITEWLEENCKTWRSYVGEVSNFHVRVAFDDHREAIAFKLRWL